MVLFTPQVLWYQRSWNMEWQHHNITYHPWDSSPFPAAMICFCGVTNPLSLTFATLAFASFALHDSIFLQFPIVSLTVLSRAYVLLFQNLFHVLTTSKHFTWQAKISFQAILSRVIHTITFTREILLWWRSGDAIFACLQVVSLWYERGKYMPKRGFEPRHPCGH